MDTAVYVALSKQSGAERQMAVIANNIANANTSGYKAEAMVFSQYMNKKDPSKTAYANDVGTVRNDAQGDLQATGNPLDLAIQGDGYFEVNSPQGPRYTRAGNFTIDGQGYLVDHNGYTVGDAAGQAIQFQPEDQKIVIYADGRMEVDGNERATVGVFTIDDKKSLKKEGDNMYSTTQTATANLDPRVAQGMLENSNVSPIVEMTKMISVQRDYERSSNFINQVYDLQGSAIQVLGKAN